MQRPECPAFAAQIIQLTGLGKGAFGIKMYPRTNARISFGNPVQASLNQLFRGDQTFGNLPPGFTGCQLTQHIRFDAFQVRLSYFW